MSDAPPIKKPARPAPRKRAATTYASSEKTRARLIDAAGQLAVEVGFARLTTRAVAKRAGEGIGSIHYHFRSKAGLLEAALRHALDWPHGKYQGRLAEACGADLDDPRAQARVVRAMVRGHIEDLFDPRRPAWHQRLVNQAMQRGSALFDVVWEAFASHEAERFFRLLDHARPGMSLRRKSMAYAAMLGPILFHCDYALPIHRVIGQDGYDQDYFRELEEMIVNQTLHTLGIAAREAEQA